MLLNKNQFFGILFFLLLTPFLVYRLCSIAGSLTTAGKMRFMGKTISGQITSVYPVISFSSGADTIWFNGEGDNGLLPGESVPVRYQRKDVHDARINTFFGVWMDLIIIAGVPSLMLLLIYLHKGIFPAGTKFMLGKKPFFQVVDS